MKRFVQAVLLTSAVAAGAFAGFTLATNDALRSKIIRGAKDTYQQTKKQAEVMSEEVALRTAMMTNNPKITQDWVNSQWENIGY